VPLVRSGILPGQGRERQAVTEHLPDAGALSRFSCLRDGVRSAGWTDGLPVRSRGTAMECPFTIPKEEILRRRAVVQGGLQRQNMDGLLVTQPADILYLTGESPEGFVFLPPEGEPLPLPTRSLEGESGLSPIVRERWADALGTPPRVLGLELDVLSVRSYVTLRRVFRGCRFVDGSRILLDTRMIKSDWELGRMSRLADKTCRTFEYAAKVMRPGMTEIAFSGLMEAEAGALGVSGRVRVRDYRTEGYPWHVLSGKSGGTVGVLDAPATGEGTSPAFPCGAGYRTLASGDPVMVDFAVQMGGYHMDETRMFALGRISSKAEDACKAAMEIHDRAVEGVEPGRTPEEIFRIALDAARKLGYGETYLGPPNSRVRFLGHGIGLELVEAPLIAPGRRDLLAPGMTFALEPKMVFEGEFAAGVESVVAVTETGCRMISRVPVEVFYA